MQKVRPHFPPPSCPRITGVQGVPENETAGMQWAAVQPRPHQEKLLGALNTPKELSDLRYLCPNVKSAPLEASTPLPAAIN